MAVQAVCVITNQGMDLWLVQGRAPARHVTFFENGTWNSQAFLTAARRLNNYRILVLVDLVEEDFRLETIAKLHGRDHRALVERQLKREFRETPYRMLCSRFADPDERQREHVLLCGIIVTEQLDRWLSGLEEAGCRITGIHSATQLSRQVFSGLPAAWKRGKRLLAIRNRHRGLRITLFDHDKLRFSRLSICDEETAFDDYLKQELQRSRRFYENLRLIPRGSELHCIYLASSANGAGEEMLDEGLYLHRLSSLRFGFPPVQRTMPGEDADALLVELLARKPPHKYYASQKHKQTRRQYHMERAAWFVAFSTLAASSAYAAFSLIDVQRLDQTSHLLEGTREILANQLNTIDTSRQDTAYPVQFMNSAVEVAQDLHSHDGKAILARIPALGRVLARYPEFSLKAMAWYRISAASVNGEDAEVIEHYLATHQDNHALNHPVVLLIKGTLPVDLIRMPELQQNIQQLVTELKGIEGVSEALLIEDPFEPGQTNALQGVVGSTDTNVIQAPVTLLMRMPAS